MAAPKPREPMLMYIAATNRVVSIVLVVERSEEGKERPVQRPVYYLSEVLTESKQRYPQYQKMVYAVFRATRRLPHYFQEHPVTVVASAPLGDTIRNRFGYEALLHGMRAAKEMAISRLRCFGDSDLVASQVMGTCDATDPNMIAYRRAVDQLGGCFTGFSVEWIDRRKNEDADALSRIGSSKQAPPPGVFLDVISKPSILPLKEVDLGVPLDPAQALVAVVELEVDWTAPFLAYLENGTLPMDETEARMIQRCSKSFTIINNELYKRSATGVFQRCVQPEEGRKILLDIHAGDCGHHAGARSLVAKAIRHGL